MPARVQPPPVPSDEHLRETPAERPFHASGVDNRFVATVENDDIAKALRLRVWKRESDEATSFLTKRPRAIERLWRDRRRACRPSKCQ